jgi:phage-related protein
VSEQLPTGHFQAVYYRAADGSEPVREYVDELSVRRQVALENQIGRLNLLTPKQPHLPHPWSSQVEGELRELRCHFGKDHYRILYQRSENLLVLLHIFAKRTKAVPKQEKAIAHARWEDFKKRMDEAPRKPPRAAGRDAP